MTDEYFFKHLFKDQKNALIGNQLKFLEYLSSFFNKRRRFGTRKINYIGGNSESSAKFCKGQESWSIWLDNRVFLGIFDILGKYLLEVV